MNTDLLIPLLTFGGTLLLVVTGLLNFSVFVRQLRAARDQLETARRQLESARQQPQIQLVQRAMTETSDHLKILIEKPYLRPYFYDNKAGVEGDTASLNEVKAMAELMLNNFASAIIHSAVFPEYPVRGVEETIRFHLRHSPTMRSFLLEGFDRFQLAGLALICLKNETRADAERDLRDLIAAVDVEVNEKTRREGLLRHLESSEKVHPLELAKYSLERPGISSSNSRD
jgi:hypothetical protein